MNTVGRVIGEISCFLLHLTLGVNLTVRITAMKTRLTDGTFNNFAVVHMIGELQSMTGDAVSTSEIASFMGVTKPTALKRLAWMQDCGLVKKEIKQHRANAIAYKWSLSDVTMAKQKNGVYESFYRDVAVKRIQLSQMKPYDKIMSI